MSDTRKPNLICDFDDVVHDYRGRWMGTGQCAGGLVDGAREWLIAAAQFFVVNICSTRSSQVAGVRAMRELLLANDAKDDALAQLIDRGDIVFPMGNEKPPSTVSLDDRGLRFTGEWPDPRDLLALRTWTQQIPMNPDADRAVLRGRAAQLREAAHSYDQLSLGDDFAHYPAVQAALRDIARQVRCLSATVDLVSFEPAPEVEEAKAAE